MSRVLPQYPVYVPSKGRYEEADRYTIGFLKRDEVPFYVVCEPQERAQYEAVAGPERVLVLPDSNRGLWFARNWIMDHSIANGDGRHWQLDDNIRGMWRRWRTRKIRCEGGVAFRAMEDFTDRYSNVGVSGANYYMFSLNRVKQPPFVTNCHVYSCVAPETPVLCADLIWREAGSLVAGQKIVAFDEEPTYVGQGVNSRSYRMATIERNEYAEKESFVVSTDLGTPLQASAEHPWLVLRSGLRRRGPVGKPLGRERLCWVETRDLVVGDRVAHLSRPWTKDESHDGGWVSGIWDGEGSLISSTPNQRRRAQLTIAQKGGPVMDRLASILRLYGYTVRVNTSRDVHNLSVQGGFVETMRFAGQFRPTRLLDKMAAVWDGRGVRLGQSYELATITNIESVGLQPVASITTSTGTFVTAGYLTHNCSLINNEIPYRWRLAYNDDTDLCLQVLAGGLCTIQFNAFLCWKMTTMTVKGGNTDDSSGPINYQGDGRLRMARDLERVWPYVVETKRRYGRPQHVIKANWKKFDTPLLLRDGVDLAALPAVNEYGMTLVGQDSLDPAVKEVLGL